MIGGREKCIRECYTMWMKRLARGMGCGLRMIWGDLRVFNAPAAFFALGVGCILLLRACGGSAYMIAVMVLCTLVVYLAARRCGGWAQAFLGLGFFFSMTVMTLASIVIGFFLYPDFSPSGVGSYARVRQAFFPERIPATAYEVEVWSRTGFGPGEEEAYLSYRDTKANIRPYASMARERSEMRTRTARINDMISVPRIHVDESAVVPRFETLPLWQRIFIDYVPHPAEVGPLKEKFVFYVWDIGDDLNHPQASIVGISEDETHIIFYWVGG